MRKLFVREFALDYMSKAFGLSCKYTRSAPKIYLSLIFIMTMETIGLLGNFLFLDILLWGLFIVFLFFGFVYFRIKPLKFEELEDMEQIYQFGAGNLSQQLSKNTMKDEYWNKWSESEKFVEKVDNMKFYKAYRFFIHPLVITPIVVLWFLLLTFI